MGEVWVAVDRQLEREVALKLLQDRHRGDEDKQQHFLIEGQVTGLLEHPGVVPVYALGVDVHGEPFYAMRFVRGESLRKAISRLHEKKTRCVATRPSQPGVSFACSSGSSTCATPWPTPTVAVCCTAT